MHNTHTCVAAVVMETPPNVMRRSVTSKLYSFKILLSLIAYAQILFNTYKLQRARLMFVKLRGFLSNGFVSRVLQIPTLSNRQIKLLRFSTMLHFREVIF